jgi:hypothetical protein
VGQFWRAPKISPALHDLTVGLIAFDTVHLPLNCVGRLHGLLGQGLFWTLVQADIFRFVYFESEPAVMFPTGEAASGGDIGMVGRLNSQGGPLTTEEEIKRHLSAAPGREADGEVLFSALRSRVTNFDHRKFNTPSLTRGALLHPSVQALLGISDAVLPTCIPRWSVFPVQRLAHAIMVGCTCENFAIPSTKIGFGGDSIVGAAFAVASARDWADSIASYVLTSRFNTELGSFVASDLSILQRLLSFRETPAGIDLRREILDELATHAGSEFVASVNAGLRHIVPTQVMDRARDQMSGLLLPPCKSRHTVPAVWTSTRNSDEITKLWRARSRELLQGYCSEHRIGEYDLCPCRSGEKLRFCCARALRQ